MAHKNLGIIQIDLPEITLGYAFGVLSQTEITSILSEETKLNIIQALKGEKIVYINILNITDDSGEESGIYKLVNASINEDGYKLCFRLHINSLGSFTDCAIVYDSLANKFYLYS